MSEKASEPITITKEDLKGIISSAVETAIRVAKEPTPSEQRKLDKEQKEFEDAQRDRAEIGKQALADKEQQRRNQRLCSHEHPNGTSHCVYIIEPNSPGYLICQKFQCKIRPEPRPASTKEGLDPDAIYDTATFNKIFQKLQSGQGDIIS